MRVRAITKTLLLTLIMGLQFSPSIAQKNIIRLEPMSLIFKRVQASYERNITHFLTANMGVDYQIRRNLSDFIYSYQGDNFSIDNLSISGIKLTSDFRFYPSSRQAPRGFYIGPYFRYNLYMLDANGETINDGQSYQNELSGSINQIGGGLVMGVQWVTANDHLALDFTFFGPGIYRTIIDVDFKGGNYTTADYYDIYDGVVSEVNDFPIGRILEAGYDSEHAYMKYGIILPGLLFNFGVGYAF